MARDVVFRNVAPNGGDTGWLAFPVAANYQALGSGYGAPQYRKIGDLVYLRGLLTRNTSTAAAGSTAGTMGVGFRPGSGHCLFESNVTGAAARVDVLSTGEVKHQDQALVVGGWLSLDGIFYSTY